VAGKCDCCFVGALQENNQFEATHTLTLREPR